MRLDRNVLFLAYHFPPTGGAGVQRSVKFVRYLRELDFRPVVVSRPVDAVGRWTPEDPTLADEIPPDTPVFRAEGPEPTAPRGWRGFLTRALRLRSPFESWWVEACVEAGLRAAEAHPPQLVYASLDPYESAPAAARLARGLDLPWVLDLRDPWALDEMRDYPTALHRTLERRQMVRALRDADAIIMNTAEAGHALAAAAPSIPRERIHVIPNGFDPADFSGPAPAGASTCFQIVHTGYLHTALALRQRRGIRVRRLLGGQLAPTRFLTRSHVYLLRALERWRSLDPEAAGRCRLVLAGVLSAADEQAIESSGVADLVDCRGSLGHGDCVDLMRSADLLFLPMHDLPTGWRARIVPGKTYEYLASGRPILAAVPEGDARDLLEKTAGAFVCRPDDVEAMVEVLRSCQARPGGSGDDEARPGLAERFGRPALTRRLAAIFEGVLAERR